MSASYRFGASQPIGVPSKGASKDVDEDDQVNIIQAYNKLNPYVSTGGSKGTDDSIIFHYFQILKHEEIENEALKNEMQERETQFEIDSNNPINDIKQGVKSIVNELSRRFSEDQPRFCNLPVGFGSLVDGTTLGPQCNTFDFIIPLKPRCSNFSFCKQFNGINSRAVSFTEDYQMDKKYLPEIIFDCKDSESPCAIKHVDLQNLRKYFGGMILKHMPQVPLPNNFEHAGFQLNYEKPRFSGYRMHGPAFMLQFYYKTNTEEILITIDLVPAFAVESNFFKIYEEGKTEYSFREVLGDTALPATSYVVALVDSFGIYLPRLAKQLLNKNTYFMQKILRKLKILIKEPLSTDPGKLMTLTTDSGGSESSQTKDVKIDLLLRLQKYSVSALERPQGIAGELYEPWTPISSYALRALLFRVMRPIDDVINHDENDELAIIRLCMLVIVYNSFRQFNTVSDRLTGLKYSWELNQYKFADLDILPFPSAILVNEPMRLCWRSLKKDMEKLNFSCEEAFKSEVSDSMFNNVWSQHVI